MFSRWEGGLEHLEQMDCEHPLFTVLTPWQLVARAWLTVATIFQYRSVSFLSESFRRLQFGLPIFPGARICHLCWWLGCCDCPKQPEFHVRTVKGNGGAEPGDVGRRAQSVMLSCPVLCTLDGRLGGARAATGGTFHSERKFLNLY